MPASPVPASQDGYPLSSPSIDAYSNDPFNSSNQGRYYDNESNHVEFGGRRDYRETYAPDTSNAVLNGYGHNFCSGIDPPTHQVLSSARSFTPSRRHSRSRPPVQSSPFTRSGLTFTFTHAQFTHAQFTIPVHVTPFLLPFLTVHRIVQTPAEILALPFAHTHTHGIFHLILRPSGHSTATPHDAFHCRHESGFSIASASSYGYIVNSGSNTPSTMACLVFVNTRRQRICQATRCL